MKRAAFISGTLFSSLVVIGILYEIMHWPGVGHFLVFGLVGTALISVPSIALYQYNKNKKVDRK